MKPFTQLLCMVLSAVLALLVTVQPAKAVETCHKINARGEGTILTQTPSSATTEGRLIGGGLLQGTTEAELIFTGFDQTTSVATFVGSLTVTTRQGTVTLDLINGVFNTLTGEFYNDSVVAQGSGRFADASGSIYFHGYALADGTFIDDEISGELYIQRPGHGRP